MAQNQFVQIPCGKCGTTVWISPAAGMGYCPSCQTPNQLPPGAAAGMGQAPAPAPYGAPAPPAPYGAPPGAYGAPPAAGAPGAAYPGAAPSPYAAPAPVGMAGVPMRAPGLPIAQIAGAVGLAILVGGAYFAKNTVLNMFKPGQASLSSVGIDNAKKADPDKMILSAGGLAKKWRSDAAFRSINILKLSSDGTVDLSSSNVVVEYFSPSGVSSMVKKLSDDSIKKFNFNDNGVSYKDLWGPTKRLDPPPSASPVPACTAKQLATKLAGLGIKPGQFVHASYDPNFWQNGPSWHVQSESPAINAHFDAATCAQQK